ncbi:sigma-54 dependent transcriptional regulator [Candidatus Kapabacteria bacterium]|nr:sigma-54 dependent transcriptional regulator [Candidatus Kapabacteria bacterium]
MKILIADDNHDFSSTLKEIVESFGHEAITLDNPDETISYISANSSEISLMMLDIEFGVGVQKTGLDILEYSRKSHSDIPVVMISGKGTIETAVKATKLGAINFIEKSIISKEKINSVLKSAMERLGPSGESKEILQFLEMHGIIGKSNKMIQIGDNIIRFGRTELNVLVTGETGTGKKLVAKALHSISRRARSSFVTVDIPNIPHDLFQSELFGHLKGSFSGASDNKKGLFHSANNGTLFLDEIGDLPIDMQANLLIPIEEKIIRRVGSIESEEVDLRFISATDKDLIAAIKDNQYREQLYHRLRECEISLPSLRERREDIPDIAKFYVKLHNEKFDDDKYISQSAMEYIQEQKWYGNVRELSSALKVALQTSRKQSLEVNELSKIIGNISNDTVNSGATLSNERTLKEDLEKVDKQKIESMLELCKGNVSKSAAQLGVSRETLHNKIRKYEIDISYYRKLRSK